MILTITINMDNAAFQPDPAPEVSRILEQLELNIFHAQGGMFDGDCHSEPIKDINGQTVGFMRIES